MENVEGTNGDQQHLEVAAQERHEPEITLETLVARKAQEIAEHEARKVIGNYLQVMQHLLDQMKTAAVLVTGPLVTTDDEYISLSAAAKRLGTYENTIRRAVLTKKLPIVRRPSTSPHKHGLVMMVAVRDLDRWWGAHAR